MKARTAELQFAKFIERFQDRITEEFLEDAFKRRDLFAQSPLGRQMVEDLAGRILSEFTKNIDKKTGVEYVADPHVNLGLRCCEDGLSCSEMVRIFILLKRHIWLFFQESDFAGQPFDVRSIVALNNRTALFFDRVIYYFLVGYEETKSEKTSELTRIYSEFLQMVRSDLGMDGTSEEDR